MNFVGCTKVQTKSGNDAQTSEIVQNLGFLPKNAFIKITVSGMLRKHFMVSLVFMGLHVMYCHGKWACPYSVQSKPVLVAKSTIYG